jgi:hypothetical protein
MRQPIDVGAENGYGRRRYSWDPQGLAQRRGLHLLEALNDLVGKTGYPRVGKSRRDQALFLLFCALDRLFLTMEITLEFEGSFDRDDVEWGCIVGHFESDVPSLDQVGQSGVRPLERGSRRYALAVGEAHRGGPEPGDVPRIPALSG